MLGNLQPPYSLSDFQTAQGIQVLNELLKALGKVEGINIFRQTQVSLPVAALSRTVPIVPYVTAIQEARWVISPGPPSVERPLGPYAYADYQMLPNKDSQGTPAIFAFDRQNTMTQLYVWPVAQFSGTINATVGRVASDIFLTTDFVDFPDEWNLGLTYMLADALMDDQGVAASDPATAQRIITHAALWKQKLDDSDRPTSIFFRPYGHAASNRFWR
jgi:hypothetical protein